MKKILRGGGGKAEGALHGYNTMVPIERLQELDKKLNTTEAWLLELEEARAVSMADLRKTYGDKVKLRKGFHIAILVSLFQAAVILQLIVEKTHWPATGILAAILCCMALTILQTDNVVKKVFVITGITVAGYCAFLLWWI